VSVGLDDSARPAAAELRVLGPLEAIGLGGRVALPGAKHRQLLAVLTLAGGRVCSAETLVDAMWGAQSPVSARKLVQVYVSQLRKVLPEGIQVVTHTAGYALELDGCTVDSMRFERLSADASAALAAANPRLAVSLADQALALWRGAAYEDVRYDDFARPEAERLEELRLATVESRLDGLLRIGRPETALVEAVALADANPLRERAHELTMIALYRAGRQADALDVFASFRRRLDEELGLEPTPTLRDLQRRILQQDPTLDAPTPAPVRGAESLPVPATELVGREPELELLDGLLARRDARLLVLTGAGGSGKTRLALEAARRAAPGFANGVVLVELAPVRDPSLVPRAIADACQLADRPGVDVLDALVAALAEQELLLVVDNAEHVREAASLYVSLAERAPRLTVLVTSRAVLHVSGEHVVPVAPLEVEDAVTLFSQRAAALDPSFVLTDGVRSDVEEICRRVDGLPLAVELAAARIRTLTPQMLRERLSGRLELLTTGPRDLPARQRTLRDTIAWSVDLLSSEERRAFASLAVFPDGATLDAAEVVCGADLDLLGALVDDHVVRRIDMSGEPRFGLLETIREYAYEVLGTQRSASERAMAEFFAVPIEEHSRAQGPDQQAWFARLDADLDNVRAAIGYAIEQRDGELELRIVGGMYRYWWIRGLAEEGISRLEDALGRTPVRRTEALARALQGAAGLYCMRGQHDAAVAHAQQAVIVATEVGSTWDELSAETVLGLVSVARGDYDAARPHHERSAALKESLGVEPLTEMMNLGGVEHAAGDYARAAEIFDELIVPHRRGRSLEGIGLAALNGGLARYRLGEFELAQTRFVEAFESFEELGFRAHVAHAQQGLAACAVGLGQPVEAAELLGRAAHELAELGWSDDDFDPTLASETEAVARSALGDEAFDEAYRTGRGEGAVKGSS
jgi:predicted ATPase/DNA-binding SARP family transcriptional activator